MRIHALLSYSLGDAIDWKLSTVLKRTFSFFNISYSLGDAIDWKLTLRNVAIWAVVFVLLLARGRDRLETTQ